MSLFGRSKISKGLQQVKDMIMDKEEILYIHEEPIKPESYRLVLTNLRLINYCNNPYTGSSNCIFGMNWWKQINRVWIEDNVLKMNVEGTLVRRFEGLPIEEREIIYKIAKERIDAISEKSKQQTPTQSLKYLKEMLDEGLVTQAEYDAKKADLLSKM